jgi:hypothetical protein
LESYDFREIIYKLEGEGKRKGGARGDILAAPGRHKHEMAAN